MRRITVAILLTLCFAAAAFSQSIQPLGQEFKRKAKGSFFVGNKTLKPMVVVLEPASFEISADGKQTIKPLDPSIHLKLSQMSAKIPPNSTNEVHFEAECDSLPCAFAVFSKFASGKTTDGVSVQIALPEAFYVCPDSAKNCRERIRKQWGLAKP